MELQTREVLRNIGVPVSQATLVEGGHEIKVLSPSVKVESLAGIDFPARSSEFRKATRPEEQVGEIIKISKPLSEPQRPTAGEKVLRSARAVAQAVAGGLKQVGKLYVYPNPIEKWGNGQIYRAIGVGYFKNFVVGLGRLLRPSLRKRDDGLIRGTKVSRVDNYFLNQTEAGLRRYMGASLFNEALHLAAIVSPASSLLEVVRGGGGIPELLVPAIFVGLNLYCIFLQRYHRTRIVPLLSRLNRRENRL